MAVADLGVGSLDEHPAVTIEAARIRRYINFLISLVILNCGTKVQHLCDMSKKKALIDLTIKTIKCLCVEELSYLLHILPDIGVQFRGFTVLIVEVSGFAIYKTGDVLYPRHNNLSIKVGINITKLCQGT